MRLWKGSVSNLLLIPICRRDDAGSSRGAKNESRGTIRSDTKLEKHILRKLIRSVLTSQKVPGVPSISV